MKITPKSRTREIDLDNIMEYNNVIRVGDTYTTTEGKEVYGADFRVLDKEGKPIPNCTSACPKHKWYVQYNTDENGMTVVTEDGIYSGVLSGLITDEDIQVIYEGE